MSVSVQNGTVIFRRWDQQSGLDETSASFSTLDGLLALCLQVADPLLVDRVIIEGQDASGRHRVVTLVFQSVTVSDTPSPDSQD